MIHGVINVYKEKGFTSHDVVAKLRGILGQKKIGHTGTLDPDATGVLPVCLGKATKLCDMLTDKDKTYETVLLLGKITDTQDTSGKILEEHELKSITKEDIISCIERYVGSYEQVPPMYSALKVNGRKLYELAREGKEIERKSRSVFIYSIEIDRIDIPRVYMRVKCSKGTYIRTLCHDIGADIGCGGCMDELQRTKVERFRIDESLTLGQLEEKKHNGTITDVIIPIDTMFQTYKEVTVKDAHISLVYNGNPFLETHILQDMSFGNEEEVRVYDENGRFISIYRYLKNEHYFKIVKMFFDKNGIV